MGWQPVGFKGNRLQKRLAGLYFADFSTNGTTSSLQKSSKSILTQSHFRFDSSSPTDCHGNGSVAE
jgi:hypothetical protein